MKELILGILLLLSVSTRASDWPQLLGPTRDAVYAGPPLAETWPAEGPPIVWKIDVGEGYSNPIVGENRLIICHRLGTNLVVDCLDPKTAHKHWGFTHGMKFQDGAYFDSGPRPTPTIRDGKVFIHNTDGYLACLALADGKKLWSQNAKVQFKSGATWHGCISSPLVTDKALILTIGGSNDAVVALAPETGQLLWKAFDEKASGSSPILATLAGKPQLLVVTRSALHSLDPESGAEFWSRPTRKQSSGNVYCASPIVFEDQIFLSGWYNLGALLLRIRDGRPE